MIGATVTVCDILTDISTIFPVRQSDDISQMPQFAHIPFSAALSLNMSTYYLHTTTIAMQNKYFPLEYKRFE